MAKPHRKIIAPAAACIQRSIPLKRVIRRPSEPRPTTVSIVPIVAAAKTAVTRITEEAPKRAAGYITIGMSGSHGPKTKIVKRTHGVMFAFPGSVALS